MAVGDRQGLSIYGTGTVFSPAVCHFLSLWRTLRLQWAGLDSQLALGLVADPHGFLLGFCCCLLAPRSDLDPRWGRKPRLRRGAAHT